VFIDPGAEREVMERIEVDTEVAGREELAAAIHRRRSDIVSRWLARVRESVSGEIELTDLRNAIDEYVEALVEALRRGGKLAVEAEQTWIAFAQEHAMTRIQLDFDVRQLLREFMELRRVLFETMQEEGVLWHPDQANRLAELTEAAVTMTVSSYVESQQLALRMEQDRLRLVLDAIPSAIAFIDSELVFQLSNRTYQEWLGVPVSAIKGKRVPEILGEENFRCIRPHLERVLRGDLATLQSPFVFAGGRRGFAETILVPQTSTEGSVIGVVGIISDITERRHREELERARAELEQYLVGIVSHDLRNPLNAILLGTQSLLRREDLDERTAKMVTRIQSAAGRAARMIADLLDFTRIRLGGGITVNPRPSDLRELTRQVVDEIQMSDPDRQIEVRHEGDARGLWDSDRLAQVLTNLLTNAVRYSTPGTPIVVTTRGEGEWVLLDVHNVGTPIAPERMGSLFQPLHRRENRGESSSRSVGLGLFIVRHLVEAHRGTIDVVSSESEGTTFTVRLPRQGMIRKDYIERLIDQLAQVLARLLHLRKEGQHEEALRAVREASMDLFGLEYEVLVGVDPASAAGLLGESQRVRRFAELVREEAESLEALGERALAEQRRAFAGALSIR
jgi:PAS domain S-box-containing protein